MVKTVKVLNDPQLGDILFRKNTRAKKYIIRTRRGEVNVTIPPSGTYSEAKKFLIKHRETLIENIKNQKKANPASSINESELRQAAHSFLPQKLNELALNHGFQYNSLRIRKSRTRWGSCSSKKNINLSLYLMLLPVELIEYVILHELCHTVHMNHSQAFWILLDEHTQGNAKELRKALRTYSIP